MFVSGELSRSLPFIKCNGIRIAGFWRAVQVVALHQCNGIRIAGFWRAVQVVAFHKCNGIRIARFWKALQVVVFQKMQRDKNCRLLEGYPSGFLSLNGTKIRIAGCWRAVQVIACIQCNGIKIAGIWMVVQVIAFHRMQRDKHCRLLAGCLSIGLS